MLLCALALSVRLLNLSPQYANLVKSAAREHYQNYENPPRIQLYHQVCDQLPSQPSPPSPDHDTPERLVLFEDIDPDDAAELLAHVSEQLDAHDAPHTLVAAGPARWSAADALRAHIERYELRRPLERAPTHWRPDEATLSVHAVIDGALVEHPGVDPWWDVSTVAAYDGVVDEALRSSLLALLCGGGDPEAGPDPARWERGALYDSQEGGAPSGAGGWGLTAEALERLCATSPCPKAVRELQSRVVALLEAANPELDALAVCRQSDAVYGGGITPLAANAPVAADGADGFGWHIDADPASAPPSPWTDAMGRYPNRLAGAPRFVSALVYLSPTWRADEWGAPTRFLDPPSGEVFEVAPAPGRLVLMDQDIQHAVTAPKLAAGCRPRYSLVLKLVLHPGESMRPGLGTIRLVAGGDGEPTRVGSARRKDPCSASRNLC